MTDTDWPQAEQDGSESDSKHQQANEPPAASQHHSLKYHLLGPSLTKSGQDGVDQTKVSEIIYNASKGSKYFTNEENKDKNLTVKINRILAKKRELQRIEAQGGLKQDAKRADEYIAELEYTRDLSQSVVHVDCDAFYAAVEMLDRPELATVPFAVGKGVLTTCNYLARQYGCRSGMAGFVADKLCPDLVHVPLNFDKYTAKAKEVRAVLEQYDPHFQSASMDEAYLNITNYCEEHSIGAEEAVQQMRAQVFEEAKITVSAGIAANAKLAKICSNKNKPDGQFYLFPERINIMQFMDKLPTRKVNGIGRVMERELDAIGIETCGDIYDQRHYLQRLFGEKGFQFLMGVNLGLGRTDIRPIEESERKSVGTESTFGDLSDPKDLRKKLSWIADELEKDMKRTQYKGRTLVLKIKLHTYEVISRQVQPPKAVYTADDLYHFSYPMLEKLMKEIPDMRLRLMGLRCTHLVSTKKGDVDFFGRAREATKVWKEDAEGSEAAAKVRVDNEGWQIWPDEEFEEAEALEKELEADELNRLSQRDEETDPSVKPELANEDGKSEEYKRYANGFAWRSILEEEQLAAEKDKEAQRKEEWMKPKLCPICSLRLTSNDKDLNEHVDLCLSRQTIKELVQTSDDIPPRKTSSPVPASNAKRKRGQTSSLKSFASQDREDEKRAKRSFFT